jgi:hypothetical protein
MMKTTKLYLLTLCILLLSACVGSTEPTLLPASESNPAQPTLRSDADPEVEAPAADPLAPTAEPEEAIVTTESELPSGAEVLVDIAKTDLAVRLGIELAEIELISFEEVVWPDASLGCPHPDMNYRQIPMDGSRIVLAFEGTTYDYHSGGGREPFLCEQVLPGKDTAGQIDLGDLLTPSPSMDQ